MSILHSFGLQIWLALPTPFRLSVYKLLMKLGKRLYGPAHRWQRAFPLPFGLYVKIGSDVRRAEAEVMQYLSQHTTIPVPRVLDVIDVPSGALILMKRIPGRPLLSALEDAMTISQRELLAADLRVCFEQLRAIKQPTSIQGHICNLSGGTFSDVRIGPEMISFTSQAAFNENMYNRIAIGEHARIRKLAEEVHSKKYPLVLTHCDFIPTNVMVDEKTFRLTGIIDWECCAWLPSYWEYTRSRWHKTSYHEWLDLIDSMLTLCPKELAIESEIWRHTTEI